MLARRLRELAEEREIALSHLADRSGVARSYLWRLLNADSSATLDVVQRLADVLEVPPLDLLVPLRARQQAAESAARPNPTRRR